MINVCTEEEARKKYCCQAIHMLGMKPLINCMGDSCMAWKWGEGMRKYLDPAETPEGVGFDIVEMGYCGLTGKP
ncbi:hypothetical protein KAR91_09880 [Candidatus Pacearchaeota archaeon]|nr:hypothetical protein [Candidatus Pacearchaeota archaeon]